MTCPRCRRWKMATQDVFCSWCCARLADFEFDLIPSQAFAGDGPPPVRLVVRNTGLTAPVEIASVTANRHWLRPRAVKSGQSIPSGASAELQVDVDSFGLESDYHDAVITVRARDGSEKKKQFRVVPYPEVELVAGEFDFYTDAQEEAIRHGYIRLTTGALTVAELKADAPWAEVVPAPGFSLPFLLDVRTAPELPFVIQIKPEAYENAAGFPPICKGNVIVRYLEWDRTRQTSFAARCWRAPHPNVESSLFRVFPERESSVTVLVSNKHDLDRDDGMGRAPFRILNIETRMPGGKPCEWVKLGDLVQFPIEVAGGKTRDISFTCFDSAQGAPSYGLHTVPALFEFAGLPAKTVNLEFSVERMPAFEGVLAIDYGTTNTCAALVYPTGRYELLDIDETYSSGSSDGPATAPSAIQYFDRRADSVRRYQIGSRPASLVFYRDQGGTIVTSAKRYLGSSKVFPITFRNKSRIDLSPREIVTDYLLRVRHLAEQKTRKRITHCVITHPSRFALTQIRDLHAAARACFGSDCTIEHMHEPIAAAMDMVLGKELLSRDRYTMMVYDFGGGTTDITLIEVTNERHKGAVITYPRVLGANGHPRVGGDDATEIVARAGYLRFCELLNSKEPGLTVPLDREKVPPALRQYADDNSRRLHAWAEMAKILLSRHGDNHEPQSGKESLELQVVDAKGQPANRTFPHREIVMKRADFDSEVRKWLKEKKPIEMMKELARSRGVKVDLIVLAGKASLLDVVDQLIREAFPQAEIVYPKDVKQCVVAGACRWDSARQATAMQQIRADETTTMAATTSRIGVQNFYAGENSFSQVIPAGEPIPEGGLKARVSVPTGLARFMKISLLENIGANDEFELNGKPNADIIHHGHFEMRDIPPEITPEQLKKAEVELEISRNLDIAMRARFPNAGGEDTVVDFIYVEGQTLLAVT